MNLDTVLRAYNSRLSVNDKWLVFDSETGYIVYQHKYGKHKSTILYQGDSLDTAIAILTKGE